MFACSIEGASKGRQIVAAKVLHHASVPGSTTLNGLCRLSLVQSCLDPRFQYSAAGFGKGGLRQAPWCQDDHIPAKDMEYILKPRPQSFGRSAWKQSIVMSAAIDADKV